MLRFIEGFLLLALQACGVAVAEEGEAPYVVEGEEITRETITAGKEEIVGRRDIHGEGTTAVPVAGAGGKGAGTGIVSRAEIRKKEATGTTVFVTSGGGTGTGSGTGTDDSSARV